MTTKQKQIVVIHREIQSEEDLFFSFNLKLNFTPSSVIVRSVITGRKLTSPNNYVYGIIYPWTNGKVGSTFIWSFKNTISNPDTIFNIDNPQDLMNGAVNFNVVRLTDIEEQSFINTNLSITLEFIK